MIEKHPILDSLPLTLLTVFQMPGANMGKLVVVATVLYGSWAEKGPRTGQLSIHYLFLHGLQRPPDQHMLMAKLTAVECQTKSCWEAKRKVLQIGGSSNQGWDPTGYPSLPQSNPKAFPQFQGSKFTLHNGEISADGSSFASIRFDRVNVNDNNLKEKNLSITYIQSIMNHYQLNCSPELFRC